MLNSKSGPPWLRFIVEPEAGGGGDPEPVEPPEDENPAGDEDPVEDEPLGAPGVRALEKVKEKERRTREKLRAAQAELTALKAPKDGEQTPDQIQTEAETRAAQKFHSRIVRAEVRAAAAASFADPEDAAAFLNLNDFEVDDDGNVDADDIEEALTELLARKPHLAKQDGTQGASKKRVPMVPADPANSTHAPVTLDDQIAAATEAGDWKKVLRLQNQKLVESK